MNNLNTFNLKDTITATLQEILATDPNFFFPNRLTILSWKSKKINGALITKVGNIRYLGLLRKDKLGQEYWKYKPLTSNSEQSGEGRWEIPPNNSNQLEKRGIYSELSPTDNIAKFQQRQEKSQNYGKANNSEQSVNNSQSS